MLVIKCSSCGFELYKGRSAIEPREVIKQWGGRCPVCMSPLSIKPLKIEVGVAKNRWMLSRYPYDALHIANKKHVCCRCGREILKGDIFFVKSGSSPKCIPCVLDIYTIDEIVNMIARKYSIAKLIDFVEQMKRYGYELTIEKIRDMLWDKEMKEQLDNMLSLRKHNA